MRSLLRALVLACPAIAADAALSPKQPPLELLALGEEVARLVADAELLLSVDCF